MLIATSAFTVFLPSAKAVNVTITPITPTSGKVGDSVQVVGTINMTNGSYRIWFSKQMVKEANASANSVSATFPVPAVPKGTYNVTLQDVEKNLNATTTFRVDSAFYINAITLPSPPGQLQENSTVNIQVNVTGGQANTVYHANITVTPPAPANRTYWSLVTLTNITTNGNGVVSVIYPSVFHGALQAPNTNYVGTYNIAFNKTLATNTFIVGITNSTKYHRGQIVDIKAGGYKSNETATIKITFGGKAFDSVNNTNATGEGLVLASWPVPRTASNGTYTLNITSISSSPTTKNPPDIQSFTVPGFDVNMTTENLATEIVQGVRVEVFENGKSVANGTSNSNGFVQVRLEIGNYTFKASYKGAEVYERRFVSITNTSSFLFYCNLTNLRISVIAVKDGLNVGVPEVRIYLTRENKTLTTDINGTAVVHSLLPSVNYTLNASRYGVSFNVTRLSTLLINQNATAWYNVTFKLLPTSTLRLNATDSKGEPINNATVKVQELMGGILYENNTNPEGIAIFQCIFGKYNITIYDAEGIKLNETTVSMFQNQNVSMPCELWGLTLSIKVVDYFGQPISKVKVTLQSVTLQQEGLAPRSQRTGPDGVATFDNISGGNLQITVYLSDKAQPYVAEGLFVGSSATVQISLEKYVMLAGFLVETSSLTVAILIIASVILVLSVEVYRRKRVKPQQKPELEPE
jgi:hypothetical protein